jgi:hypothetical protein
MEDATPKASVGENMLQETGRKIEQAINRRVEIPKAGCYGK